MLRQELLSIPLLIFLISSIDSADGAKSVPETVHRKTIKGGTDLELIRNRVISDLLQPAVDEVHVKSILQAMSPDGSWPDIDYEDVSRTGFEHARHLQNMLNLSRAFKNPASPFHKNAEMKKAALASLDFWLKNDFICDNWWWNEMGTPHAMINTLLVLDTDLSE